MHEHSDRLASLASPAFIAALALLVLNDFVLKPAFHNAVTGKLSDFAGLFALTLFVVTLWPRWRWSAGCALAAAFTFWKTSHADSLIESLNVLLPFAVSRTVDLADLIALPMIPLAAWAAPRLHPWSMHRALRIGLAIIAPIAFAATSMQPQYLVRQTVELGGPTLVVSNADEAAVLQQTLDEVAGHRGFICTVCDSLDEGRVYGDRSGPSMTASLDPTSRTLYLDARAAGNSRRQRDEIDRLLADVHEVVGRSFRIVAVDETSARDVQRRHESVAVELKERPLQTTVVEAARRTVSGIVETIAVERGLRVDENTYYLGRRLGPSEWDRQLVLYVSYVSHATTVVVVTHEADAEDALADTLLTELETRMREAFPADLVTRAPP